MYDGYALPKIYRKVRPRPHGARSGWAGGRARRGGAGRGVPRSRQLLAAAVHGGAPAPPAPPAAQPPWVQTTGHGGGCSDSVAGPAQRQPCPPQAASRTPTLLTPAPAQVYYSVSAAVHSKVVRVRAAKVRRNRDPPPRPNFRRDDKDKKPQ